MNLGRREFVAVAAGTVAYACLSSGDIVYGDSKMYGRIGKMTAAEGKRDELIKILTGNDGMPGCLSYIVAKDPSDANAIWITEVWDNKESHAASLKLSAVQAAIVKGRPMITGFSDSHETEPVGGIGLPRK